LQEFADIRGFIHGNADHLHVLALAFLRVPAAHGRHFFAARTAPCGPKVNHLDGGFVVELLRFLAGMQGEIGGLCLQCGGE